ncbi:uncharacterized protein LOC124440167 [Xenia sp. Carnegie-2017]|uniref:uncharacterized protein LOC124440167 n=1 Tax=Xenia sp. Carnegie-2017 TaxID=2897299 RepID=UPI001F04B258|nr:uncharacterized protein LOC124440167 [Xenia sp. Carnegie-2017]
MEGQKVNYSRMFYTVNGNHYFRHKTPTLYHWKVETAYSTTTQVPNKGVVKKLFNENKPIFFGILGVVFIILLIILIQCHRKYCKKDNKTEQKKASNYTLSFSKEELHLPHWKKSPVQPKRRKQRKPMEIRELGQIYFTLKYDCLRSRLNVNILRGEDFPLLSSRFCISWRNVGWFTLDKRQRKT